MNKRALAISLVVLALVILIPLAISFVNSGGFEALAAATYNWSGATYNWSGATYNWSGATYNWSGATYNWGG